MKSREEDARERIMKAARDILEEVSDVDTITVRQIAVRAKVGVGLINYHFKTRNQLLSMAIGAVMSDMVSDFLSESLYIGLDPVEKLKKIIKELCNAGAAHRKLIQFMLTQEIMQGGMQAPLYLIPFLREIFGKEKEEIDLRIIAMQLLSPIQTAGICPSAFQLYGGINLYNEEQRNRFVDMLVDNVTIGRQRCLNMQCILKNKSSGKFE